MAFLIICALALAAVAAVTWHRAERLNNEDAKKAQRIIKPCSLVFAICFVIALATYESPKARQESALSDEPAEPQGVQVSADTPNRQENTPEATQDESESETGQMTQAETETPQETPEGEADAIGPEEPEQPTHEETDQEKIERKARSICTEWYQNTSITNITVNENLGTDETGDYVLLVDLTWNVNNGPEMTKEMLEMYSEDFAARVGADIPTVNEFAVFWTVPNFSDDVIAKYSYTRYGDGMQQTDVMLGAILQDN